MTREKPRLLLSGLLLVFVLALLPRVVYPVTWPMQWYTRSVDFYQALIDGDLTHTFQKHHPGVTTMWVAGLGLRIYAAQHGWTGEQLKSPPVSPEGIRDFPEEAAVASLATFVSLCIVLMAYLLWRLWGSRAGMLGGILLALDPFLLTYSKVLHVDAMVTVLMAASMLLLLNHRRDHRRAFLWLSGLFGGLAFLSKSPSVFLVPYVATVVVLGRFLERAKGDSWGKLLGVVLADLAQWGLAAGLTFVALWPAMWAAPLGTLSRMVAGITKHVENAHSGNFFAGRVVSEDVGFPFYAATLAWKTTTLTFLGGLGAVITLVRRGWRREGERSVLWLAVYVGCFTLMMSLAAGKEIRYLLPVFPAVDMLAAWGIIQARERLLQIVGRRRWLITAGLAILLLGQGYAVLRFYPYFGLYHNELLGGTRVAQHMIPMCDQGEGIVKAAEFLNQYPGAERMEVAVPERFHHLFYRHFKGIVRYYSQENVDFKVFAINTNQRLYEFEDWGEFWQDREGEEPLWSMDVDGVPFVWLYPAYPDNPQMLAIPNRLAEKVGDQITLIGYRLDAASIRAGDTLQLTLFWKLAEPVRQDLHVFVHLLNSTHEIAAQRDGVPVNGERPTWSWYPGEVLEDGYSVPLPGDLAPGTYTLAVGMYDFGTGLRPLTVNDQLQRWPNDAVVLAEFDLPAD